ncbi:hypothetical protein ACIBO5_23890 [Nonomuraea angiospora]|uniref:hypothetical protein n=1 Tax=Nonomuraea angiospora TaxID=46172 RepID=UPI00379C3E15
MRAYLRLWDLLQRMDGAFEAALEDALATERDRPDLTGGHDGQDDDEGWASDDAAYYGDPYLGELRQEERNRVDFERTPTSPLPRPPDPRAPHGPLDGVDTSHIRPTIIVDV